MFDDSDDEDGIFPVASRGGVQGSRFAPNMPPPPFNAPPMQPYDEPQQMPNPSFSQSGSYMPRQPAPQGPPMPQGPGNWQQQQPMPQDDAACGLDPRSWPQQGMWGDQRSQNAPGCSQPGKGDFSQPGKGDFSQPGKGWPQMQRGPPPQMPPTMPPNMPPNMPPQMQPQMQMSGQMPMQGAVYGFIPAFVMDDQGKGAPPPMRQDGDGWNSMDACKGGADFSAAHMQAQMRAQAHQQAHKGNKGGKGGGGHESAYPEWQSQDCGQQAFQQSPYKGGKGACGQGWAPPMSQEQQQQMFMQQQQMGQAPMGMPPMSEQRKGQEKGSRNRQQMPPGQDDWSHDAWSWQKGKGFQDMNQQDRNWQKGKGFQANQQQNSDGWQRSHPSKRNGGKKGQSWFGDDASFGQKGWPYGDKGGFNKGNSYGKTNFDNEARQMAAGIAAQPRGSQDWGGGKGSGGLANMLRKAGKPSAPTQAEQRRAAKAKNPHEHMPSQDMNAGTSSSSRGPTAGDQDESRGKGRNGGKNAPVPGRSLRVSWVLPQTGDASSQGEGEEKNSIAKELEGMDLSDIKAVLMRLENSVAGCQVTVNLNGEDSVLNSGGFGKKGLVSQEKRFKISPLSKSGESDEAEVEEKEAEPPADAAVEEELPKATDSSSTPPVESSTREEAEDPPDVSAPEIPAQRATSESLVVSEQIVPTERRRASAPVAPAAFAATVTLDTSEVQAKTTQELIDPDVDVVDIFDTAAVLRMTDLTGDRFELTVYASGSSDSAATLVHRGPIRSSESVHRIGQLEPSQVYVAWVRVFCEHEVRESKQKGFKTLAARVKTIWDQPDHEILGVSKDATAKEITKAFRQKSLQCHPDKETDPEKKDAAEEHMKRLNLAKQNMMRCAPKDQETNEPDTPTPAPEAEAPPPADADDPQASPFFGGPPGGFDSGDDTGSDMDYSWRPRTNSSPKARSPTAANLSTPEQEREEGNLCCSLRIEAAKPPKLQVIERGLTTLSINASGLPLAGMVEVQQFQDGTWQAALPAVQVTSETMRFTLTDLQENSSYRLRLRTTIELEPLRLSFAKFIADSEDLQASSEPAAPPIDTEDLPKASSEKGEAAPSDNEQSQQDVLESEEELDQEGQTHEEESQDDEEHEMFEESL